MLASMLDLSRSGTTNIYWRVDDMLEVLQWERGKMGTLTILAWML